MPTFDATPGAVDANSYITVADADDYFERRLSTDAWDALTVTADKERALMAATLRLDQVGYIGSATSTAQALKWPRAGAVDENGNEYDWAVVPTCIKYATCELALAMLNAGGDTLADDPLHRFISLPTPDGTLQPNLARSADSMPSVVERLISHVCGGSLSAGPRILKG